MVQGNPSGRLGRRGILKAGAALGAMGAVQVTSPFIVKALGEVPFKIGFVDPLTGSLSLLAVSEVQGAHYAVDEINKKGGIAGRQVQLFVEDSANDVGTGVEKIRELIDKDHVDVTMGDVNSAIAYAVAQVATEKGILHIVPGGHTDPITGKDCAWNVFRICNTTSMDANAISQTLIKKFGKRWYFITPDYAYGHTLQAGFVKNLEKAGGTYEAELLPIANSDFSASLIRAKAYKPDVLLNNMGGLAQIDCMKQFVQFGMAKDMALGGALFECEEIVAVPAAAQTGWWDMEWWWDQPGVPYVKEFVDRHRRSLQEAMLGAALVRLCRDLLGQARRREGEEHEGDRPRPRARGHGAAARGRAAARQGLLPRRRSRADAQHFRGRSAYPAGERPLQLL